MTTTMMTLDYHDSVFEMCPPAKLLFGFPMSIDPKSDVLLKNERFLKHSEFLLGMIHKAVGMLGVDNEELGLLLHDLGKKHVTYGVKAEYFPFMAKSVVLMMKEMLGSEFSEMDEKVWNEILEVFIADMVKGQRSLEKGLASANKTIVGESWAQLEQIRDYDEEGGILIFEK
jgi:hemoglobin-like flavoprotein